MGGENDDLPGLGPAYDELRILLNQDSDVDSMTSLEFHQNDNDDHGRAPVDPYQSLSPGNQKPVSSPAKITESVP